MPNPVILADQELFDLTAPFQTSDFDKDFALELVAAGAISMIIEPGDRVAGALTKALGSLNLLSLLIEGLPTPKVVQSLRESSQLEEIRFSFGDLEQIIADSRQRWLPRLSKSRLEHLFRASSALGLKLLTQQSLLWPEGLNDLQDFAPPMLFVEGRKEVLGQLENAVSIVGSRAFTPYGKKVTDLLVRELSAAGRPTVSGGAVGIDAAVHLASLENNLPTIAVMAGGLDRKYPKQNFPLFDRVLNLGALVSELPPGVAPTRWRFLQRNRLIAALTPTTVVIEAGIRSGSIRTANNALELDRELFAVPGSVFASTSKGTNALIGQGKAASLFDLELLSAGQESNAPYEFESSLAKRASDAIREAGYPTRQEIAKLAGLTDLEVNIALTQLQKQNLVIEDRGSNGVVHYALKYAHGA